MEEYKVIIHHLNGQEEHTSRFGYSADHVLDMLNDEDNRVSYSVIPPLPSHSDILVKAVKADVTKTFTLADLNIIESAYTDRLDLFPMVKSNLIDYDRVQLVN